MVSVLVVDDDPEIVNVVTFLLEREGYEVESCEDGHRAKEFIDTQPPSSLAVLDVNLPFIDGYHLLKEIRNSETWGKVPVVMLTGAGAGRDVVHALDSGANDYIQKPFQPEELMARVRRLMEQ